MKYIYKIDNNIFANAVVNVWSETSPEVKTRLIIPNFKTNCNISGHPKRDEARLASMIKSRFNLNEVELEEVI